MFSSTMAESEARILKQNRLLREELGLKKKTEHDSSEHQGHGRKKKIEGGAGGAKDA